MKSVMTPPTQVCGPLPDFVNIVGDSLVEDVTPRDWLAVKHLGEVPHQEQGCCIHFFNMSKIWRIPLTWILLISVLNLDIV